MHTQRRTTLLSLLAAAALLLSSCDNSFGVFSSIQDEVEQTGTDIFKNSSVKRAFAFGANYYANQNKLFTRTIAGSSWTVAPINGSSDYETCFSATKDSNKLYASVEDSSGANAVYSSSDGLAWTRLDSSFPPSGAIVDMLFYANGYLFAQCHAGYTTADDATDDSYSLYYSDGSSAFAAVNASLTSVAQPFVGVVWDTGASCFWYATRNALYQGTSAAPPFTVLAVTATGPIADSLTITSIAYSAPASALYVGTYTGKLYQYTTSWQSKSVGSGGPITAFADVGSTGSSHLLVGEGFTEDDNTDGGYYEGSFASFVAGASGDVAKSESIYDTTVIGTAVNDFYWDDTKHTLFICVAPGAKTSLYGLYSSVYSTGTSSWSGWDAE